MKKHILKILFESKGLAITEASKLSGVPYVTLHQICSGRRNIGTVTAVKLSKAFGVPLCELRPDLWSE